LTEDDVDVSNQQEVVAKASARDFARQHHSMKEREHEGFYPLL
jgi:hypothetical protein